MNYLTLKRKPTVNIVELRIVPDGTMVDTASTSMWALRTGNQVLDVYGQMVRGLKPFYMSGNLDRGATYVIDHDEAHMVICKFLGPDDKQRAADALYAQNQLKLIAHGQQLAEFEQFLTDLCGGALKIIWVILAGTAKVVWYCVLTILFMRWMHKRKR